LALNESLQAEALRVLDSTDCICGSGKDNGKPFCRACFFALPAGLRVKMYNTFSEGYAEDWDEARDWLRANTTRLRRPPA